MKLSRGRFRLVVQNLTRMKLQAPNSKHQRNTKFQASITTPGGFGFWSLEFLWMLALGIWSFCLSASAAPQKNILLIIADDYGVDSSSLYNSTITGAKLPPTPNINSLATNGVVFRNAYANPLCSPTRACLLTGRFGFRTGIGDVVGGAQGPLPAGEFTLP